MADDSAILINQDTDTNGIKQCDFVIETDDVLTAEAVDSRCQTAKSVSENLAEVPVVIYERQKNRKTEQADGIPKPSQGESSSTAVYQALQSEEEIQNIDSDCNLNDDINSSETHSIAHKSEFSFIMPPHI